ncbi:hypothetical protein [Algoriphagus sp.]|uniref:hypothetical protein n=1 Tax=Algoriphagus sp. TaxID=1872435 RepID=UPI00263A28A2|nr:hypothetical protein [Algoriphagus sp.]
MQVKGVQKPAILIASGLKPVKDSRAFDKLGLSLRETNKYRLNFIGFSAKSTFKQDGIRFFSSLSHTKSLGQRALMPFRFLVILLKIRPKILICCTWEFLPIAKFFKPLLGYRLIYDVQENYCQNLNLNPKLSRWKRRLGKKLISWAEKGESIDYFFLAESCYATEMRDKSPHLILENKYAGAQAKSITEHRFEGKNEFHFVLGGTISPAFGSVDAIHWFEEILKFYPKSTLTLIGHVPLSAHQLEIEKMASSNPRLNLIFSSDPIDHLRILEAYQEADFILMPYQNRPEINSKMPTKLFEAAALGIPLLYSPNPKWEEYIRTYRGGYPMDFSKPEVAISTFQFAIRNRYFSQDLPVETFWACQEPKFLALIDSL